MSRADTLTAFTDLLRVRRQARATRAATVRRAGLVDGWPWRDSAARRTPDPRPACCAQACLPGIC